jgi:ABC-type uncharacterized transport system ATPase subunit
VTPGKSTTIKILCTLADPTSGAARVAGYDVVTERDTVRRNIGLVFQVPLGLSLDGRGDGLGVARYSHSRVSQDRITGPAPTL